MAMTPSRPLPRGLVCSCFHSGSCGIPLWEGNCYTITHLCLCVTNTRKKLSPQKNCLTKSYREKMIIRKTAGPHALVRRIRFCMLKENLIVCQWGCEMKRKHFVDWFSYPVFQWPSLKAYFYIIETVFARAGQWVSPAGRIRVHFMPWEMSR